MIIPKKTVKILSEFIDITVLGYVGRFLRSLHRSMFVLLAPLPYVRTKSNKMQYFRNNQKQLCLESYQNLYDHIKGAASNDSKNIHRKKKRRLDVHI